MHVHSHLSVSNDLSGYALYPGGLGTYQCANKYFFRYYLLLGASACVELNRFEEAITWCDKGLAVSFITSCQRLYQ